MLSYKLYSFAKVAQVELGKRFPNQLRGTLKAPGDVPRLKAGSIEPRAIVHSRVKTRGI